MSILFIVIGAVFLSGIIFRFVTKASVRQTGENFNLDEKINLRQ